MNKAYELGFPPGTTIYFVVDYDAYDFEVRIILSLTWLL
ncbi:DUF1906 domain-containing protein [Virgibacillus sp. AGTR]|nr:DUF1906 domain-containing protein [Virgibacillus sp. AGTR]